MCNSYFFIFWPVSSPSSETVDHIQPNEKPNLQTRSITNSPLASPTTNVLINNSIPFCTLYHESEDEQPRPTTTSRQNVRPLASRPKHPNSQHYAESMALYKQHRRENFASCARVVTKPRFNCHFPYKLKQKFLSWEISYWESSWQEFAIRNNSLPSQRLVVPLKSNRGSPASMTLNPFVPTFRSQQRPKLYC